MLVSGGKIVFFMSVFSPWFVQTQCFFCFFFTVCSLEEEEGSDTDALVLFQS